VPRCAARAVKPASGLLRFALTVTAPAFRGRLSWSGRRAFGLDFDGPAARRTKGYLESAKDRSSTGGETACGFGSAALSTFNYLRKLVRF